MRFDYESDIPLYLQVAQQIESGILSGAFSEETQIPSTTEISASYRINPATVLKGMTMLCDQELLYKKRGIGMFVRAGAVEKLRRQRQETFYETYVAGLLEEAKKLGIGKETLILMITQEGDGQHE